MNPGTEQNAGVGTGPTAMFPDLVLTTQDRGRKIVTVIEVETVESVNNLEALAEWVTFGRLKPALHLYIPASMIEVAKRLCTDHNVPVAEIYSYHLVGDELRFVQVYRAPADGRPKVTAAVAPKKVAPKPAPKPAPKKAKAPKPAKPARRAAKPTRKGAAAARSSRRK